MRAGQHNGRIKRTGKSGGAHDISEVVVACDNHSFTSVGKRGFGNLRGCVGRILTADALRLLWCSIKLRGIHGRYVAGNLVGGVLLSIGRTQPHAGVHVLVKIGETAVAAPDAVGERKAFAQLDVGKRAAPIEQVAQGVHIGRVEAEKVQLGKRFAIAEQVVHAERARRVKRADVNGGERAAAVEHLGHVLHVRGVEAG